MTLPVLLAIIAPWFPAAELIRRFDPGPKGWATFAYRACLTFGFANGLSSASYFLWLNTFGKPGANYCLYETIGFLLLGVVLHFTARPSHSDLAVPNSPTTFNTQLMKAAFAATFVLGLIGIIHCCVNNPHGWNDTWAIWNTRARMLFRSGDQWINAFHPETWHGDYPLMLSANIARLWTYLGTDAVWVPFYFSVGYTVSAALLLTSGLIRLRGLNIGLAAGLLLMGTYRFWQNGGKTVADVPLSFYVLAALVLMLEYEWGNQMSPGLLILSGFAAACASWTKNEGLAFLLVYFMTRGLISLSRMNIHSLVREVAASVAGAVPIGLVLLFFKFTTKAANDLTSRQSPGATLTRLTDPERYRLIVLSFIESLWGMGTISLFVLVIALYMLGRAPEYRRGSVKSVVMALVLMSGVYFLTYLTTPWNLKDHLDMSMTRLIVHLWPSVMLAAFVYMRDPVEAAGNTDSSADVIPAPTSPSPVSTT